MCLLHIWINDFRSVSTVTSSHQLLLIWYDTNYSSTNSSTVSLKLLIAYPVALLVSCSIQPYGVLLHTWSALRVSSALNTPTVLVQLHIIQSLPNLSSIMQLGQKGECSQITYSTAAVTMSNNQVRGRCQHNTINQNHQNITHHPGISLQLKRALPIEGGGIRLTTFATRLRISISWSQKPPCGRSIPS